MFLVFHPEVSVKVYKEEIVCKQDLIPTMNLLSQGGEEIFQVIPVQDGYFRIIYFAAEQSALSDLTDDDGTDA